MPRRRHAALVAAGATIAVTLWLAANFSERIEAPIRDAAMRSLPNRPASATVVVAIDEGSLRRYGPWPWPRDVLAQVVERAAASGARAVILDVLLAGSREEDDRLSKAMSRVPTLVVAAFDERGQWVVPASLFRSSAFVVHGNFELDHDGILRRFASTKQSSDQSLPALSLAAASLRTAAPLPVGDSIAPLFRTPPRSIPRIGVADLLQIPGAANALAGKLVFVGPTALGLGDRVLTPVSGAALADPGVTVHAAATEALIRGDRLRRLPPIVGACLAGLLVGSVMVAPEPECV